MNITKENIENNIDLLKESMEVLNKLESNIHTHIHILYVIKEIMGDKCKTYLEIGVYKGKSIALVMQSKYFSKFYGVDNLKEQHASESEILNTLSNNNKHHHLYEFVKGDSTDNKIIKYIHENLIDGIDLFFIDGEHDDTPYKDLVNYFDLVNSGGIIAIDDYYTDPEYYNPYNIKKDNHGVLNCVGKFEKEYRDKINVIGQINNLVDAQDSEGHISKLNNVYIIQKK